MTTPWREMPEFAGIDLEDSRVLGWHTEQGRIVVDLALRLLPGHTEYRAPHEGEAGCDRAAHLVFEDVSEADGVVPRLSADFDWAAAAVGDEAPRLDTLAYLRREDDGRYRFDAVWGAVRVRARALRLQLEEDRRAAA